MPSPIRVVHYLNQFFGGVGGEEQAGVPVAVRQEALGPGRPLQLLLGDQGAIVATIICGDNYFAEQPQEALEQVSRALQEAKPDVVVAGPAFEAGRYGLACGAVCQAAEELGIPAVTAMHPESPGVLSYRSHAVIIPTSANLADMPQVLVEMHRIATKLGLGEELGPAEIEGYVPRGIRKIFDRHQPGYLRAVDMLTRKLQGESYQSEVPFHPPEAVTPAVPIADLSQATIALVSTGGLIPKGNPDRQSSGNADHYFTYSIDGLPSLTGDRWEAFHSGYYNQISSDNPNYVLPLRQLRHLESNQVVGRIHPTIFTMPGVSTPVAKSQRLGQEIAQELKEAGVDACILVAT